MQTYLKRDIMAVIAIISILGGFLYVQDLKGEVESLRTVVGTQ